MENKVEKQDIFFLAKTAKKKRKIPCGGTTAKKFIQGLTKDFCTDLQQTEKNRLHQLPTESTP